MENATAMDKKNLTTYLYEKLDKRGWNKSDLARASNISKSQTTRVLNMQSTPSQDVLIAFARALGVPREEVFRAAGLLQPVPNLTSQEEEMLLLFSSLSETKRREVLSYIRFKAAE